MTNNGNGSNIERVVMRRVHRVRTLRLVINAATVSTAVFLLALYGIGREVWVARVLENAPEDLQSASRFYLSALTHTRVMVQLLCVAAVASLVASARALARSLKAVSSHAFA